MARESSGLAPVAPATANYRNEFQVLETEPNTFVAQHGLTSAYKFLSMAEDVDVKVFGKTERLLTFLHYEHNQQFLTKSPDRWECALG